jgi:hypothetical protein
MLNEDIREWELRAAKLAKKLEAAPNDSELAADLGRVRNLIATTREMRRQTVPAGTCGMSAGVERRNRELDASDDAQFRHEAEQRLAKVKNE